MRLADQAGEPGPSGSRSMVQVSYPVVSMALSRGFLTSLSGGFPLPEVVIERRPEMASLRFSKVRAVEVQRLAETFSLMVGVGIFGRWTWRSLGDALSWMLKHHRRKVATSTVSFSEGVGGPAARGDLR